MRTPLMALLLLSALLFVGPPAAAAQDGSADAIIRYARTPTPSFVVHGNGTGYNALLVDANAGDTITVNLELRLIGGVNDLTAAQNVTVAFWLEAANGTRLALNQTNVTLPPGDGTPIAFGLNGSIPTDFEKGRHVLLIQAATGGWDPNPDNNDPAPAPLQLGAPVIRETPGPTGVQAWLGPTAFIGIIGLSMGAYATRNASWRRRLNVRWTDWRFRRLSEWVHLEAGQRRTRIQTAVGISVVLTGAFLVRIHGSVGFGVQGLTEALLLGVVSGVLHLVFGTIARVRMARLEEAQSARPRIETRPAVALQRTAKPALQTLGVVFVIGILWQQTAAVTSLLRWPDFGDLFGFVAIGLSVGGLYGLIALGYTMVYGTLKFINFAHGEVVMWGAYVAWFLVADVAWVPMVVGILASVLVTGFLGVGIERVAYRRLRKSDRLTPLITAIAVSVLLAALAQFVFGARSVAYGRAGSTYRGSALEAWLQTPYQLPGTVVDRLSIIVLVVAVALMVILHVWIRRSRMGRAIRAVADDMETARTVGIPVDRAIATTFFVGSGLAAVAGILYGLRFNLTPTMGLLLGIKAFTAAVVGGIGNIYGAFLGGIMIGVAENVGGQFIDSRFQRAIAFAILVIFLVLRPQGLLGTSGGKVRK